ncbi:MAG: transglycosylase SLT domain-containing protein [Proteobacteria bacterium]|nr:transglycosylase SLT domain-containing protein [Pseudomonadota bacterium]
MASKVDNSPRRKQRLLTLSACCATLGSALILLAACSTPVVRPSGAIPVVMAPVAAPQATAIAEKSVAQEPVALASPWPRLRARFELPGCDYSPDVRQFAAQIASSPAHLTDALKTAMPFLLVVVEQIEKNDMPGEFAFLPWVESSYTMLPARGNGVAGMWQLMPFTARANGLQVDSEYDGRLDVAASSRTALALLTQYKESFGDWRLANMAYNAGENSLRAALGKRHSLTAAEIGKLRLNKVNYEHLIKLLAVSCIVSSPERFHVELPEPGMDDVLVLLELPAPVDLGLVAKLADMDVAKLRSYNPAYLKARMPERGPFRLLVPAIRRETIVQTLDMLPHYAWRNWRDVPLRQAQTIDTLSMAYDIDAGALSRINHIATATNALPAGTRLMLPDRNSAGTAESRPVGAVVAETSSPAAQDAEGICTVRTGDTLWNIAQRYGVRMEDLVHWNRLPRNATLRLGQKLVLNAPDRD